MRVAVLRCAGYHREAVLESMRQAVAICGGLRVKGKRVLLKPNILTASDPDKCVTTHPDFVWAAIRLFQEKGARVCIGESPASPPAGMAFARSGIKDVADETGVEIVDFNDMEMVNFPEGALVKQFRLPRVLREVNMLVSLPKLKTHNQMYYTGALKNMFGVIKGLSKSKYHFHFADRELFSRMLVDLNALLQADFVLMDAITAMQGHGPQNGRPYQSNLIMASHNLLALDWVAACGIGYDSMQIPMLRQALERGLWLTDPDQIQTQGDGSQELPLKDFELIKLLKQPGFVKDFLPAPLYRLAQNVVVPRPVFNHRKCILCKACIKVCAAGALTVKNNKKIDIDYRKCIRCYCCDEVCPAQAIKVKRKIL